MDPLNVEEYSQDTGFDVDRIIRDSRGVVTSREANYFWSNRFTDRIYARQIYYNDLGTLIAPKAERRYGPATLNSVIYAMSQGRSVHPYLWLWQVPQWLVIQSRPYPLYPRSVSRRSWVLILGPTP